MSKPDDIPQDVWDKSNVELTWTAASTDGEVITALRVQISRAIMAAKAEEREACCVAVRVECEAILRMDPIDLRGLPSRIEKAIVKRTDVNTARKNSEAE